MYYIATMLMEKKMKISRGEAIGCLNSEYELIYWLYLCNYFSLSQLMLYGFSILTW